SGGALSRAASTRARRRLRSPPVRPVLHQKEACHAANDRHDARPRPHHVLAGPERAQAPMILQQSATAPAPRWEVSLEGRVGFPTGYIRVSETVTHGTRLRLSDLGLDVSEAVEAGVAFWLTPRDAVRATYLYYFLRGSASGSITR